MFNLLEEFHGEAVYDQNVASYLELLRIPYTGCNPRGLMLARGKDLSKKLLAYHRIPLPAFAVFPMRRKIKPPGAAHPPADRQERERGCLLRDFPGLGGRQRREAGRARHLHPRADRHRGASPSNISRAASSMSACWATTGCACLPIWELEFGTTGADRVPPIATEKVKHDVDYQERHGIHVGAAEEPLAAAGRQHQAHRQAHLPHARARRLCPHRLPALRRRHPLFHRGQPQSRDRRRSRSSPRPPATTGSNTPTCCIGSWCSASAGREPPELSLRSEGRGPTWKQGATASTHRDGHSRSRGDEVRLFHR